jgi:hypothetical protein
MSASLVDESAAWSNSPRTEFSETTSEAAKNKNTTIKAVIDEIDGGREGLITVSQVQYLNNILEQNHRRSKALPGQ